MQTVLSTFCGEGLYALNGVCTPCPSGTFMHERTGMSTCKPARRGFYAPALPEGATIGATSETICPVGHYSDHLGSTACAVCPAGYTTDHEGDHTAKQCRPARSGYYLGPWLEEHACPAGSYNPHEGKTGVASCLPCAPDTFSSSGATQCCPCCLGWTSGGSSTSCQRSSYIRSLFGSSPSSCDMVNGGTQCPPVWGPISRPTLWAGVYRREAMDQEEAMDDLD